MSRMLAEIYGKATGCSEGKGGSMHLADLDAGFVAATPVIGATIAIAVGVAFAAQMRDEGTVTVNFFGDAATEEGIFHESLAFAALKRLPIIFVCENNLYSVMSPLDVRQAPGRDLLAIARANGVPAAAGDGNDVEEVQRLATEAVVRARDGDGPTVLEFATYRLREHCGPRADTGVPYRPTGEYEHWTERDPVAVYRQRLLTAGRFSEGDLASIDTAVVVEVAAAVRFAKESPFPAPERYAANVYS
jgi:pyruvate dehydrogenase E1 component alpha subunit